MLTQPLKAFVLLFLCGALVEDATIFALAWLEPDLWFRWFHPAATPERPRTRVVPLP